MTWSNITEIIALLAGRSSHRQANCTTRTVAAKVSVRPSRLPGSRNGERPTDRSRRSRSAPVSQSTTSTTSTPSTIARNSPHPWAGAAAGSL